MTQIIARTAATSHIHALTEAGYSPLMARLLAARGVADATAAQLDLAHLLPPDDLMGIHAAAQTIASAISAGSRILVIGDYDCDGATACAVALRGLRLLGVTHQNSNFLVPNRFEYGYGLSPEIVELAANHPDFERPELIITVDNGMASDAGVARAHELNMPVLITDHHLPADTTPAAVAIVNPNQHGCAFASKHLAGVGVMFYVLIATRARLREAGFYEGQTLPNLSSLLDLVALGTVADVVKLDTNNRILVANGIKRIRAGRGCAGVNALLQVARREPALCTSMDMGFAIGPRLNAAGRLDDMSLGIRCLLTDDAQEAQHLAQELDAMNQERKNIELKMREEAQINLGALNIEAHNSISVYHDEFHQGVIGIVAGRIKEKHHRPTIVFAADGAEFLKGSGRSIAGIHLRDVLDWVDKRHPGVIVKFGGHAMAAGLTIVREFYATFQMAFEQAVTAMSEPDTFIRQLATDGELAGADINLPNIDAIGAQVWGQGFAAPVFEGVFEVIEQRILKDAHLKLTVKNQHGEYSAIWFFHAEEIPSPVRLVYQMQKNEWRDRVSIQFLVEYAQALEEA